MHPFVPRTHVWGTPAGTVTPMEPRSSGTATSRYPTRCALFAVGATFVGAGVAGLIQSGAGATPFDVLNTALAERLDLGVGTASWIVGAAMLAAAVGLGRRPRAGTVIAALLVGVVINTALDIIPEAQSVIQTVIWDAAAFSLLWAGITALVTADLGAGAAEELTLAFADHGLGIHTGRWLIEGALVISGAALGGDFGINTVLFAVGTGPVLAVTLPAARRLLSTTTWRARPA